VKEVISMFDGLLNINIILSIAGGISTVIIYSQREKLIEKDKENYRWYLGLSLVTFLGNGAFYLFDILGN